jgi:CheY-like chemotaxis protein
LALTRDYHPSLITLDIFLPDMAGWRILERLKSDLATRHIPVCVVSTDDSRQRALNAGAVGFLTKPLQSIDEVEQALAQLYEFTTKARKRLMVMLADSPARTELLASLDPAIEVVAATTASTARLELAAGGIDCLVTDGSVRDFGPEDVIEALENRPLARQMPIVLVDGEAELTDPWERGHSAFALRKAESLEQKLDAVAFFLHRGELAMSEQERRSVQAVHTADRALEGKKVLIVDDDMRNIFALAALLDAQGMVIVSAENGSDAIRLVETDPGIDIVLMDIMMPEMDGMQTMRRMRELPRGKDLPLIAVTAKAMKGDREKCIDAGAWDYLSKPVDTAYLLVVIRGWLTR